MNKPSPTGDINRKVPTGIPGFDIIGLGGIPAGCTTLVTGTTGSAKTVFAFQFLIAGIVAYDEPGIFVTFEERPDQLRRHMASFGWDLAAWERQNKLVLIDAALDPRENAIQIGEYEFSPLLARIEVECRRINAQRVALDSVSAVFTQYAEERTIRRELARLNYGLGDLGITTIMTAERLDDYGPIARFGVEEFVADNVVILRNHLDGEKRRRTVEILKFRGTDHQKGEFPFTITPKDALAVLPLSAIELKQRSSTVRISSGIPRLDEMCGGGFFRDSILLISGATGTGKTLTVAHFVEAAARTGERALLLAFEESQEQLLRNASGWGIDFQQLQQQGLLRIVCRYPEVMGLEDHLLVIKEQIEDFKPQRVAIDSLSAAERVGSIKSFREFVIGLTSYIKQKEIAGLFTSTTPTLMGGTSVTEAHISTITDTIILLRYVEVYAQVRRGVMVLKMRGSHHEKTICEFTIDQSGMHIGTPFRNIAGILSGLPLQQTGQEVDNLRSLFEPPEIEGDRPL